MATAIPIQYETATHYKKGYGDKPQPCQGVKFKPENNSETTLSRSEFSTF
jgi:hypothetical protein